MLRLGNRKGSTGAIITGMTIFIVGVVILFISIFIAAELGDSVNTSLTDSNNTDLQNIYNDSADFTYTGLRLMGISMLIIGAIVVISAVKSF